MCLFPKSGAHRSTGHTDAGDIAIHLHCSERTLSRRLAGEGKSLRRILDAARFEAARRLMTRQDTTLEEVAFTLGFSEPKAFHRAFVRWTGKTPGEYRRQLLRATPQETGENTR